MPIDLQLPTGLDKALRPGYYRASTSASGGMVDALASGASVLRDVEVQVLSRVPMKELRMYLSFFIS